MSTAVEGIDVCSSLPGFTMFIPGFLDVLKRRLIFSMLISSGAYPLDGAKRPRMLQTVLIVLSRFTSGGRSKSRFA